MPVMHPIPFSLSIFSLFVSTSQHDLKRNAKGTKMRVRIPRVRINNMLVAKICAGSINVLVSNHSNLEIQISNKAVLLLLLTYVTKRDTNYQ